MTVLLLHPGAMGASIGAALRGNGHDVTWLSAGRSEATRVRAERAGLHAVATFSEATTEAEVVISVCPPEAAAEVAAAVAETGFGGIYVDANAVSPATAARIGERFGERTVDGGIIGPPAWREGATRLYLSGAQAGRIAALFDGTLVDARAIDGGIGAASALKMCYAAFTKGSSALLLAVRALAESNGVTGELLGEWDISQPGLASRSANTAKSTSPKAWRFAGEMREIAATFRAADLPDGFHQAAADLYARMAALKDSEGGADIDTVLRTIMRS
ncbi:MAG: NAD(P)-dependent oxidoreductase [Gammaproteobacteria bacterium]|nr:NAD(P)-dependent oxidoreductase [Gammaproteobacteria bacterium]